MTLSCVVSLALLASPPTQPQFLDLVAGKGTTMVATGDMVTMDYRLWDFETGTEYRVLGNKPPMAAFAGGANLAKGLDKGLMGMKQGQRRVMVLPADAAYGTPKWAGVPEGKTLGFEVVVLRIDKKDVEPKITTETLKAGTGDAVKTGDEVVLHYVGTFLNGVGFDSSRERGRPFSFKAGGGQVIKGFDEGVVGMKAGETRRVTIPPSLGYGLRGAGEVIPPNATLQFELELLSFKRP